LRALDRQVGYPYLAHALHALTPIECNHPANPTMACDEWWRVYINSNYFYTETPEHVSTSIVHEVWHLLLKHFEVSRMMGIPRELRDIANICEDLVINQMDDMWKKLPSFAVMPDKYDVPPNLTYREYWDIFKKRVKTITVTIPGIGGGKCGNCAHGHMEDYMLPPPRAAGPDSPADPGVSKARAEMIIRNVAADMIEHAGKGIGNVPGGWLRWANEILDPKVNWIEKIPVCLNGIISKAMGKTHVDHRRISRRQHFSPRIIQPGKVGETPHIAIVIDTSGSMADKQIAQGLAEVDGVLVALGSTVSVTVYFTDAAAADAQVVTSARELRPIGGGGTDMCQGFIAVEKDFEAGKIIKPALLIFVTDGYTGWPSQAPDWLDHCFILCLTENGTIPEWCKLPDHDSVRIET